MRYKGSLIIAVCMLLATNLWAQSKKQLHKCCGSNLGGIVWRDTSQFISLKDLAKYCAPILWFSPDEPSLRGKSWEAINIPEPMPFEESSGKPVVYYRVREVLEVQDAADSHIENPGDHENSLIDLDKIFAIRLDYFFYYSSEEGLGSHPHDIESAEFKLEVNKYPECEECPYVIRVDRVIGRAHGLLWYNNILQIDKYVQFPISLLIEEGKHATCTDKNGDGYFTPSYDVNRHINDAWGVRDVIRSGFLFSGAFETYMAKVRNHGDYVVPPLPEDSPFYEDFVQDDRQLKNTAEYELRPFPTYRHTDDERLRHLIEDKGSDKWPREEKSNIADRLDWLEREKFVKSIGISYRWDGQHGLAVTFPLLFVKHIEVPLAGGWLVNRMYGKDKNLRDFGHNILYTSSASRWFDGYFAVGYELDRFDEIDGSTSLDPNFVAETGVKFRVQAEHTPLSIFSKLTDFWGLRLGIRYLGFTEIRELGFVVEFGAGIW